MITLDMKAGFFDRASVVKALGKAQAKVLKEFGRLVRKRAQASLKYGEGTSAPGSPPIAHKSRRVKHTSRKTGKVRIRTVSLLRDRLFFAYDTGTRSTVIGPERLPNTVDPNALPALEYGGPSTAEDHGKRVSISVKARPFMGPALQAELPGLPAMWRDSVR